MDDESQDREREWQAAKQAGQTAVVVITTATLLLSATVGISGERKDKGKGAKRTEEKAAEAMISQGADSSQNQKSSMRLGN